MPLLDCEPDQIGARLGNLYLQDGVWNSERILPPDYVKFVSTPAPAWVADKLPIYGGFFWINGLGQYPVPRDSYYMAGAGGQQRQCRCVGRDYQSGANQIQR